MANEKLLTINGVEIPTPPKMPLEGQANTLKWLLSNPAPEEIKADLEILQSLCGKPEDLRGWGKLNQEQQADLMEQLQASNYLLDLALKLLAAKQEGQPIEFAAVLNSVPYKNIAPQKTAISNSLVANKLMEIEEASKEYAQVNISPDRGGAGSFKVITALKYDDDFISLTGKPLTAYDKTVHNAICALYEAGNNYFTLQMAYKAINGITEAINFRPEMLEPLKMSIEAGIRKRLTIDATQQIQAYYKKKVKKVTYENYFLPLKKITVTHRNGETLEGYAFLDIPPLYQYSKNINQVISVDSTLLDTRQKLKNSPEVATLRDYLIKRIELMKSKKNAIKSNKILYSSIYKDCGIIEADLDKTQQKRKRDAIKKILEHFIEEAYIKSYEETKDGRTIDGLIINF